MTIDEAKEWLHKEVPTEILLERIYEEFKLELEAEYIRGQDSILSRSCEWCKYLEDRSSIFYTPTHLAKYKCSHPLMNVSDGNSDLTYVGLTFMCNRWEQK